MLVWTRFCSEFLHEIGKKKSHDLSKITVLFIGRLFLLLLIYWMYFFLILWPFAHTGDKPSQLLHFTTYIKSSQYLTLRAAELHQNLFVQVESSQCAHTVPTVCFTAMLAALLACTAFAHLLKAKCLPFPANMLTMFTSWFLGQHVYHFVSVQCYNMLTFAKRKAINTDSAAKNAIRHLSIN